MAGNDLALNPQWRERIAEVGRANFVREEMLRLGFCSQLDEPERSRVKAFLDQAYPRLAELKKELTSVRGEIEQIGDFEALMREVRRLRIERVRREREEKKARTALERAARSAAWAEEKLNAPPFLGPRVSSRLIFEGGDAQKLTAMGLPHVENVEQLASLMNMPRGDVLWLAYERAAASVDHYTRFEIPKRAGGKRLISSPKPKLRIVQSWIAENVLSRLNPSEQATAFRPGTSIVQNAIPHMHSAIVVRLDLKDFFPSISFRRVRGYFEHLGFNPGVATILGLICTDAPRVKVRFDDRVQYVAMGDRSLPQGACTSPALANLIASPIDARLLGLTAALDSTWSYTRYADDLTFSSADASADVGRLLRAIEKIVTDEGFRINSEKTAVMRAPGRQVVTGLLVGEQLRLSRRDLRRLRAFLHRCDHDGLDAVSRALGKDALCVARGHLAYLRMVMPDHAVRLKKGYAWL